MSDIYSRSSSDSDTSSDSEADSESESEEAESAGETSMKNASVSPHLVPPPKPRDPPNRLDTAGPVPPQPHCLCNKQVPFSGCHDNGECVARYLMGRGFDFYKNPEQYKKFELYSDFNTTAHRAVQVKCRAMIFVRDLRCKRLWFLLWMFLGGKRLRLLGIWREPGRGDVRSDDTGTLQHVAQQKAFAAHAAAVADASSRFKTSSALQNALLMIPSLEDYEDRMLVHAIATDTAKICKKSKDHDYRHTLRLEARLFLLRVGSILPFFLNDHDMVPSLLHDKRRVKRFSMKMNPLCFLPCMDIRHNEASDGASDGADGLWLQMNAVEQCICHRIHNGSKSFVALFNDGFNPTIIHVLKWMKSPYNFLSLQTAVNLLLEYATTEEELQALQEGTGYYKAVRDEIEKEHAKEKGLSMQQIRDMSGLNPEKGFTELRTACELRWGTVPHAAGELLPLFLIFLLAILRRFAYGTEEAKAKASSAIVSHRGFFPSEHPGIKLEAHAQRVFALFNRTSDLLQLAVLRFLYNVVVRLFLKYASDDHDCGTHAMSGLNSVVRNVMLVLSRDIWVKIHRSRRRSKVGTECIATDSGWGKKMANPFRSTGAEFSNGHSLRLLNPDSGKKVNKTLGFAGDEQTRNAPRELVLTLRTLARREGPALPEDIAKAYASARPLHDAKELGFAEKMSQFQDFFFQSTLEVLASIEAQLQRELYSLKGMLAGMTETEKTSFFSFAPISPEGPAPARRDQFIVKATCWSLAHAVAVKIGVRDVIFKSNPQFQLYEGELPNFLPSWGSALSKRGLEGLNTFLGISNREEWGNNFHDADKLPPIQGCELGLNTVDGKRYHRRPLQFCDPDLYKSCRIAQYAMGSSKPAEGVFSTSSAMMKTKGSSKFSSLVHLTRRLYWKKMENQAFLNEDGAEQIFWAACALGRLNGWGERIFSKDKVTADLMHANWVEQDPKQLPATIKKGGSWKKTNFSQHSRTKKYLNPAEGSEESRRLQRLISTVCARVRGGSSAQQATQDLSAQIKRLQARARNVRARKGQTLAVRSESVSTTSGMHPRNRQFSASGGFTVAGRGRGGRGASTGAGRGRGAGSAAKRGRGGRGAGTTGRGRGVGSAAKRGRFADAGRGSHANCGTGQAGGDDVVESSDGSCCDRGGESKRRRCRRKNGGSGSNSDRDESDSGDLAWSPGREESDLAAHPQRVTRAVAARGAAALTGHVSAARESPMGTACAAATSASDGTAAASVDDGASAVNLQEASESLQEASESSCNEDVISGPRKGNVLPVAEIPSPATGGASAGGGAASTTALAAAPAKLNDTVLAVACGQESGDSGTTNVSIADLDDDTPIFAGRKRKDSGAKSPSDSDASDSSESSSDDTPISLRKGANVWSFEFCLAIHNHFYDETAEDENNPWHLSKVEYGKDTIKITRKAQKVPRTLKSNPQISFDVDKVRRDDSDHLYILFDSYAGGMLVSLTAISTRVPSQATSKNWAKTLKYRRVYTSQEALNRSDSKQDKRKGLLVGQLSLEKFASEARDEDPDSVTYHIGDCEYKGDIRGLIGIVRWYPLSYRSKDGAKTVKQRDTQYPHTDIVFVGPRFSEKTGS